MENIITSWMWADEQSGGVKGARLDLEARCFEWVDQPGCACSDATTSQSIADFQESGPLERVPADVHAEMRAALSIDSAHVCR